MNRTVSLFLTAALALSLYACGHMPFELGAAVPKAVPGGCEKARQEVALGRAVDDDSRPEALAYHRALSLCRALPEARLRLGTIYYRWGLYDRAAEELRAAYELEPKYPGAANRLALALFRGGKRREAAELLRRYTERRPSDAEALVTAGLLELIEGRRETAAGHLDRAAALSENARLSFWRGALAYLDHRDDEAARHLDQALEERFDYAAAHFVRASLYSLRGVKAEALHHWHLAAQYGAVDASFPKAWVELAKTYRDELEAEALRSVPVLPAPKGVGRDPSWSRARLRQSRENLEEQAWRAERRAVEKALVQARASGIPSYLEQARLSAYRFRLAAGDTRFRQGLRDEARRM